MTARNTILLVAGALAALIAAPLAAAPASAQEAIMLETIGAVRMVSPAELQRRDAETVRQQHLEQAQQAPRQHAEVLR